MINSFKEKQFGIEKIVDKGNTIKLDYYSIDRHSNYKPMQVYSTSSQFTRIDTRLSTQEKFPKSRSIKRIKLENNYNPLDTHFSSLDKKADHKREIKFETEKKKS